MDRDISSYVLKVKKLGARGAVGAAVVAVLALGGVAYGAGWVGGSSGGETVAGSVSTSSTDPGGSSSSSSDTSTTSTSTTTSASSTSSTSSSSSSSSSSSTTKAVTTTKPQVTTVKPPATSVPASSSLSCSGTKVYDWTDRSVKGQPFTSWNNGAVDDYYYADQDMWGAQGYSVSQHMVVCSNKSWAITATADDSAGDGAVKTYPNIHHDYHNWSTGAEPKVSSFSSMTSTFSATSPHVGVYDVSYDIWLNGVADNGSTEVMIWTENYRQQPYGDKVASGVSLGGRTYDVWKGGSYIAFVPRSSFTSGTVDLLGIFKWVISKGWIPASSTVGQVDFGVEIVSTGGRPATFTFPRFSISSSPA